MERETLGLSDPSGRWVAVGDLNIHFLDWGGPGKVVIALHGAASSCRWYDLVIAYLRRDFRFIALDLRAHGKTDQPSSGYDWGTLAADVVGVMNQLGIPQAAVIGHSWGANVALSVAALHPDRVSALALIDGGLASDPGSSGMTWEEFKTRLRPRDIYGPRQRYLGILQQQFSHCWSDHLEEMVMSMVRVDPDDTVHERLEPNNQVQLLWAMWSDPTSQRLNQVRSPTLLVVAQRPISKGNEEFSQRRRRQVETTKASLFQSRVVWILDSGHDIGYEKPRELADTLREFLADG